MDFESPVMLRQAMARTRTWTAAAAQVERERTRQVARIGNNLNQIARWANTQATPIDALSAGIKRTLAARFSRDEELGMDLDRLYLSGQVET